MDDRRKRAVLDFGDHVDGVLDVAARCVVSPMIDVAYWNGLQIWQ